MLTVRVGKVDFAALDDAIRRNVPHGFGVHERNTCDVSALGLRCFGMIGNVERLNRSLGTLGGGNHFIAVDEDEDGHQYLVIHTGSRNLGLQVATIYQTIARETCDADVPGELAWLDGGLADDYLHDMRICQRWAEDNRRYVADEILMDVCGRSSLGFDAFHTTHNYISFDDNVIRKGAIDASLGRQVLIPLNMRDGSLLCRGLGNADWNNSAPHGAGRTMSRGEARRTLDVGEFRRQMSEVYSTTVCEETIDEAPGAYKDANEIVEAIDGVTVDVVARLREVYNFKSTQGRRRKRKDAD
jgi:RNA-splicing ligase RtcB